MFALKDSRNTLTKMVVIDTLPSLAKHIPGIFNDQYLERTISHLLGFISKRIDLNALADGKNKDRGNAFIALGKLSTQVPKPKFQPFAEEILKTLGRELQAKNKTDFSEVLTCVKMFVTVYGGEFERIDVIEAINDMFYFGLNRFLIEALTEMMKINQGKYRNSIQIKLLNAISLILAQKPFNFSISMNCMRRASESEERATSLGSL